MHRRSREWTRGLPVAGALVAVACGQVMVGTSPDAARPRDTSGPREAADRLPTGEPDTRRTDRDSTATHDQRLADGPTLAFCPGGQGFGGGELSGVYEGTAQVAAGKFNVGGVFKATVALASACGEVRGIITVEQQAANPLHAPSYKLKAKAAGLPMQAILSDRYCGELSCMPHLQAGAGMEIFTVSASVGAGKLTISSVAIKPGVSYADLELPFTSLTANRTFPTQVHSATGPVAGTWDALLSGTTAVFAVPPLYGSNQLVTEQTSFAALNYGGSNVLADKNLFPTSGLESNSRRVFALQTGAGGDKYEYLAVLDGNWLVGVVRDAAAPVGGNPSVPTDLKQDDSLLAIWVGARE